MSVANISEDDRVLVELSSITAHVITELQNGAIRGIKLFEPDELTSSTSLGGGGKGEIYRSYLNGETVVAVKVLKHQFALESVRFSERESKLIQYFIRECGLWKSVDSHPNIVTVLGFATSFPGYSLPAIVTEYYELHDLRNYVNEASPPVQEAVRLKLLIDACSGLKFIHSKNICHRDIKAGNIFIKRHDQDLIAAIGDFGSAKLEDQTLFKIAFSTASTSLAWTPPEYVHKKGLDYSSPTAAGDMWSFGCTILEVLTGDDPWPPFVNVKAHLLNGSHPSRPDNMKDGIWRMLDDFCWCIEPSRRKAASVIKFLLQSQIDSGDML